MIYFALFCFAFLCFDLLCFASALLCFALLRPMRCTCKCGVGRCVSCVLHVECRLGFRMCMYPCVHAVRLKYNGFKAPVFVVRAFVVRMMSAWCAPSASEHVPIRTVAAELFYLNHVRSQAASAFGSQGRCSGPSAALCKSGAQVLLGFVMGMIM